MRIGRRFPGLDGVKGLTLAAVLLAALAASCGLSVGGLGGGTEGATASGSSGGGGMTAATGETATSDGTGTGASGAGGATSSSSGGITGPVIWHSYDVTTESGQLVAIDESKTVKADIKAYQASNATPSTSELLLTTYEPSEYTGDTGYNHVQTYLSDGSDPPYPYVGKSTTARGGDTGETADFMPTGVFDLQLHPPPDKDKRVVAAFEVPFDGDYSVADLGVRRVDDQGDNATFGVFVGDELKTMTGLQGKKSRHWDRAAGPYPLGSFSANQLIYFTVSSDGDPAWDATEIAWTLTGTPK